MNGATLNTAWLGTSVLSATRLNTVGTARRKGGSTPPEPVGGFLTDGSGLILAGDDGLLAI